VVLAELRRSPFLDDLTPADRRVVPLLLTLPVGMVAAVLAAVTCGLAVFVAFAIGGGGVESVERLMAMIGRGETPAGLTQIAFVISLLALLPLGTELLWENGSAPSVIVYVGLVTAIGLAHALAWGYAAFVGGLTEPMSTFEKIYVLLRVALLPGLMCGLTFLSIITRTPWGWLGMALVVAGLAATNRLMARSGKLPPLQTAED
jgi:hypothetical protein